MVRGASPAIAPLAGRYWSDTAIETAAIFTSAAALTDQVRASREASSCVLFDGASRIVLACFALQDRHSFCSRCVQCVICLGAYFRPISWIRFAWRSFFDACAHVPPCRFGASLLLPYACFWVTVLHFWRVCCVLGEGCTVYTCPVGLVVVYGSRLRLIAPAWESHRLSP